jgi:hypothetical protein
MKCKETLEAGTARGFHYCTETDEHDIHHCHCGRLWTTENNESGILVFRIKDAIEIRGTATNEESIQQFFSEVRAALDLDREASPQTESPSPFPDLDSSKAWEGKIHDGNAPAADTWDNGVEKTFDPEKVTCFICLSNMRKRNEK